MPWNPDSGDPLSADILRVSKVEENAMKLWAEYLTGWLDGGNHLLRGESVRMPGLMTGGLTFQEQDLPKDMNGLCLHVVTSRPASAQKRLWSDSIWHITEHCRVDFQFRALVKGARADGHNSRSLVRWGADTLFAILESNIHTVPLQRKGMGVFRPQPSVLISGGTTAMRMLSLNVVYNYSNQETVDDVVEGASPVLDNDVLGTTVYIGAGLTFRITPNGWERKGDDGNWYRCDIEILPGVNGPTPTIGIEQVA